jgi:hypothetical protein
MVSVELLALDADVELAEPPQAVATSATKAVMPTAIKRSRLFGSNMVILSDSLSWAAEGSASVRRSKKLRSGQAGGFGETAVLR